MGSYRDSLRRDRVSRIISIIRDAGGSEVKVDKIISKHRKTYRGHIKKLERMCDEEFMDSIKYKMFGVADKDYYIGKARRNLANLESMSREAKDLIKFYKRKSSGKKQKFEESEEYYIKKDYTGFLRTLKSLF